MQNQFPFNTHVKSSLQVPEFRQNRYNLRRRGAPSTNPIIGMESASEFSKTVKTLAKAAIQNSANAVYAIERLKQDHARPFYSSDEEGMS